MRSSKQRRMYWMRCLALELGKQGADLVLCFAKEFVVFDFSVHQDRDDP